MTISCPPTLSATGRFLRVTLLLSVTGSLAGCAVASGVATVAGTAVSVVGTAVETTVDVVTYPVR